MNCALLTFGQIFLLLCFLQVLAVGIFAEEQVKKSSCLKQGCCQPNGPGLCGGCSDGDVQTCVCKKMAYCCDTHWDELCVYQAVEHCGACRNGCGNSCESPSPCAGCSGSSKQRTCVCSNDRYCCYGHWDQSCASMAKGTCANGTSTTSPIYGNSTTTAGGLDPTVQEEIEIGASVIVLLVLLSVVTGLVCCCTVLVFVLVALVLKKRRDNSQYRRQEFELHDVMFASDSEEPLNDDLDEDTFAIEDTEDSAEELVTGDTTLV